MERQSFPLKVVLIFLCGLLLVSIWYCKDEKESDERIAITPTPPSEIPEEVIAQARMEEFEQQSLTLEETAQNILNLGDYVTVSLESNPADGKIWIYNLTNERVLSFINDETYNLHPEGSGDLNLITVYKFRAISKGDTTIEFAYADPVEYTSGDAADGLPTHKFLVKVE
jgi:predicted secreted protein